MDKDKIEIFKEAYKRGILPDDKKVVFEEAVNRGLIQLDEQIETPQSQETIEEEVVQPTEPRPQEVSPAESAFVGFGQAAMGGLPDELISGLATPVAYAGIQAADMLGFDTGGQASKSIVDIYKQIQGESQAEINEARRQNPKSFLAGEVTGSLAGGIGAASTKAGKAAAQQLTKRVAGRNKRAAIVGGGAGALYGAGTSDIGEGLQGAKEGAVSGAIGGVVGQKVGDAAIKAGSKILPVKKLKEIANKKLDKITSEEVKDLAGQAYKRAEEEGGVLNTNFVNKLIKKVKEADFASNTTAEKIAGREKPFKGFIKRFDEELKNDNLNLQTVEALDKELTQLKFGDKAWNRETGNFTDIGRVYQGIQNTLREAIENAKPEDVVGADKGFRTLKDATKLYSKAMKMRQIEKIVEKAELTDTPATSIKTGFRTLITNDKKLKGFSEQEKKIIRKIADTGVITDLFRILGNRFVGGAAGFATGGVGGMAAGIATTQTARRAAEALQKRKVNQLMNEIGSGVRQIPTRPVSGLAIGQAPITSNSQQQN